MSRAATSILVFGVYLALVGAVLLFVPNVLLGLARPRLILLGAADFLGAIWTTLALRADQAR
jgi:hypothetical protein